MSEWTLIKDDKSHWHYERNEMTVEIEVRVPSPVRGSGGSGFEGCVNKNCKAGSCIVLRKGQRL